MINAFKTINDNNHADSSVHVALCVCFFVSFLKIWYFPQGTMSANASFVFTAHTVFVCLFWCPISIYRSAKAKTTLLKAKAT